MHLHQQMQINGLYDYITIAKNIDILLKFSKTILNSLVVDRDIYFSQCAKLGLKLLALVQPKVDLVRIAGLVEAVYETVPYSYVG